MVKKFSGFIVIFSFLLGMLVFSQQTPQNLKISSARVSGPNLYGILDIHCCDDSRKNPCEKALENKGFFLVNDFSIWVFNHSDSKSGPATGKVEFFDFLTNTNKTFSFDVNNVLPHGWVWASPRNITGPFLIKSSEGIKISVTFRDIRAMSKTNTRIQRKCSHPGETIEL